MLVDEGRSGEAALSSDDLARFVDRLASVDDNAGDAELIDQITQLERMKSACAAAQAKLTVAFAAAHTAAQPAGQQRNTSVQRSIAAQIGLARRDSPARGGRHLGLAKILLHEMPNLYAALRAGEITEWRATLIARETACLSVQDRRLVDQELAGQLPTLSDRQAAHAAARIAQRLDPAHCVARIRKALGDRRVSIRPAPDTMSYVSALLPVAQGVAVYAALNRYATTATATGDCRSRGQLMADEFVTRITQPATITPAGTANPPSGEAAPRTPESNPETDSDQRDHDTADDSVDTTVAATADASDSPGEEAPGLGSVPAGTNIDIQLVMTDRTLFDGDNEPAHLTGYGPIPAPLARHLIRTAGPQIKTWIRRLYTDPDTGHLINGDNQRRIFTPAARQYLIARDQTCRTPWCDAPIRHADHTTPYANGGPTAITNGQGLCERCNYTKMAAGWTTRTAPDGIGVITTTPTGHTIRSDPPPPPRSQPWQGHSTLEARLLRHLRRVA